MIGRIRLLAEAALLRRLDAGSGFADPRVPSQIYLRDPNANARIAGGTLRPQGTHAAALVAIEHELEALAATHAVDVMGARLEIMVERLGLDAIDRTLVEIAVAYAVDLDTRELVHALATRRRPALFVETCADILAFPRSLGALPPSTSGLAPAKPGSVSGAFAAIGLGARGRARRLHAADLVRAVAPGSALRRGRVIAIEGDGLAASIEIANGAFAWLAGDDGLQAPLAAVCTLVDTRDPTAVALPATTLAAIEHAAARCRAMSLPAAPAVAAMSPWAAAPPPAATTTTTTTIPLAVMFRGPRGSGRRAAARLLARGLARPLLVIDAPALVAAEQRTQTSLLGPALAAARLRGALPYLAEVDALATETGALASDHADALAWHVEPIACGTVGRAGNVELRRPQLVVAMPRAELADRERAWSAALHPDTGAAAELAARYVIGPGAIAGVVAEATRHATAAGAPLDVASLEAALGRRLALRLGAYGTGVTRKALIAELVLPDDVIDTLRDVIAMVRERAQILERWGYQRHLAISRGVSALFSGEPGTGKTMAASVIASELGLELVRIDLAAVVSKYVGETEKNLARIFDEAQDAHAMLLFDEADSLFGKRTELRSAQDRFANLEVNYLLQRMETFDGVSILTTNAEASIDPALQRRLNFRVRFPEPEPDERARLWRMLLPPATQLHDRVDFAALAERYDMTGGYIKNAVVRAAVIAARAGRELTADDLWAGAHLEYLEMGKVMPTP